MSPNKPLLGHIILITRTDTSAYRKIEELGGQLYVYPILTTIPPDDYSDLDRCIESLSTYNWLVFTSSNSVRYFMARLLNRRGNPALPQNLKICAIGSATAATAEKYGMSIDLIPEEFRAEGLTEAFIKIGLRNRNNAEKKVSLSDIKILLPRAENARDVFPKKIIELGGNIDCPVAYKSINPAVFDPVLARLLKEHKISVATFTSSATFNNFLDAMGSEAALLLKNTIIAAIGPITAEAIQSAGLNTLIMPEKATVSALVDSIISRLTGLPPDKLK